MRHEIDKLNMVIAPVAAAFGVEYRPGEVRDGGTPGKGKKTRATELDRDDPAMMKRAEQRDAAIFAAAKRAGLPIREM